MDLRVEKTKGSIVNAFLSLRARKPLEKITVKELCQLARINKSTFYTHYSDIFALSHALEGEVVAPFGSIGRLYSSTDELTGQPYFW